MSNLKPILGIIGGSGVYEIDGLKNKQWKKIASSFGEPSDELLFGECQSSIIISIDEDKLIDLINIANKYDVPTQTIGRVNNSNRLEINDLINLSRDEVSNSFFNSLEEIMNK